MPGDVQRYDSEFARGPKKLPPLHELTRLQKRYLLEPWFTTIWTTTWSLSVLVFLACIWLAPLRWELFSTACVLFAVGSAAAFAKGIHQEMNVKTERNIQPPRTRGYDPYDR